MNKGEKKKKKKEKKRIRRILLSEMKQKNLKK